MSFEELIDPSALIFLSEPLSTLKRVTYVPRLVAFVDETIRNDVQFGHFYVMAAAILDKAHPEYGVFWRQLRQVAWSQPDHTIHASTLIRSPKGQQYLDSVECAIGESPAVRSIAVMRAKIPPKGEEIARQRCVASLISALASMGVRTITLDTRDPLGQAHKSMTSPRLGPRNALDASTILGLQAAGELPPDLDVRHGDDEKIHELWVADVAAYAVSRALADHDPARLRFLVSHVQIREARILPIAERESAGVSAYPESSLNAFLDTFLAAAKQSGPPASPMSDLFGCLPPFEGSALSIEEMNDAMATGAAEANR